MKKLFLFLFLLSCSSLDKDYNIRNEILDFNRDLTIDEFNDLLIKYSKISSYPKINE